MPRRKRKGSPIDGVLLLDKPAGLTSNTVLQKVKRAFNAAKAGHGGTLDPFATGLLPIAFGEATKFLQYALEGDKRYVATIQLGSATDTGDPEGEVTAAANVPTLSDEAVAAACHTFIGKIEQQPPRYSAIKVDGQRAYKRARKGQNIEIPTRQVRIAAIDIIERPANDRIVIDVRCGKGTYIRSLVSDIGLALGLPAHTSQLRRTEVVQLSVDSATSLEAIQHGQYPELMGLESLLRCLPTTEVDGPAARNLRDGLRVAGVPGENQHRIATYHGDKFIGLTERQDEQLIPRRMIDQHKESNAL